MVVNIILDDKLRLVSNAELHLMAKSGAIVCVLVLLQVWSDGF